MEGIIKKAVRAFALLVALCATGGAWAEYVAGWDFKGLAKSQWGSTSGTAMTTGTAPATWSGVPSGERIFTVDFTVDEIPESACALITWKMSDNREIIVGKTATTDGTAKFQLAWGYWGQNGGDDYIYTTYTGSGQYYDWTADSSSHTFRIEYEHETLGTTVYMDGSKICAHSGLRFANKDILGIGIGGAFGTAAQGTWPNAGFTVSSAFYMGGLKQTSVTLESNGYTLDLSGSILNSDGAISIASGTGLSIGLSSDNALYNQKEITTVIEVSDIPETGTLVDYLQYNGDDGRHVGLVATAKGTLTQKWGTSKGATSWYANAYGTVGCSAGSTSHTTIAFAYNGTSGVGTQTFVVGGNQSDNNTSLLDSTRNLRSIYIGNLNGGNVRAAGLRVYSIKLYTTKLDASGATAAASDVILSDGCSAAFSSGATYKYCGSGFTNGFTIDLKGQTVALGTYPGTSGTITVNDSVGGGSATMTLPEGFTGSFAGTGTLAVTAPASVLPVSGGMDLSSATITIPNASGTVIASDSVTVGNSGIQVALASTINNHTVMVKASNIPSSSCRLIGWMTGQLNSKDIENCAYYGGSDFNQCYYLDGTWQNDYNSTGDSRSWTRDASDHWIEISYARADNTGSSQTSGGTRTYFDGSEKVTSTGLKWGSNSTSKITIGGTATSSTSPATGMVIKDIVILSNALTANQMDKVTTALNNGWTVNTVGTTLTSDEDGSSLPGYSNVTAVGAVTVASGGTLDLSGLTAVQVGNGATLDLSAITGLSQVVVLPGGELTIGKQRPGSVVVMTGGILNVSSIPTASECITGYIPTAELSVEDSAYLTGTVKLEGETVTPSFEGTTATLTGTIAIAGNPTYTGDAWWWDYEFNESSSATIDGYRLTTPNEGNADDVALRLESSNADYTSADETGNRELYFQQTPWRNASFDTLSELTAVMYCAPGNYANTVLVAFGSTTATGKKAIALVTGANPAAGEMKLVLTDGVATKVTELADLTAVGATTTKHLYAFIMDRITENETEKTRVRVYLDGKVKAIYKHNGILTLSNGFQIGSLHGGVAPTGFNTGLTKYSSSGDSGTLDFLRVVDGTLTDGAMAALAGAYPYNSAFGSATRDPVSGSANTWVSTDAWTQTVPGEDDATQNAPKADTNVKLSIDGSSVVSVALNLTTDSNYESLTLGKEAGATGSLNLTSGMGNSTAGKLVSAETSVLVDTTVPAGRVNLGVTSVADGITLTVDPYSPFGNTALAAKFNTMAFGDIYEDVIISMALLGDDAVVALDETYKSSWEDAGFTIELIYDSSNLSYTLRVTREAATADIWVEIAAGGTVTWSTRTIPVPAPESLPDTYANTVTITNMTESTVAISTAFAGGNVTVASGGPVTLSGAITTSGNLTLNGATTLSGTSTIVGAMSGSATLTVDGSVTVASTGSIANTIAGDGTITFEALPASALSFGEWTGTVVLPANQAFTGQKFDDYGIAGSTVRLQGANTGWFHYSAANNTNDRAPVATTVEIPSDASLTVTGWSSSFANTFNVLKGSGTFAVNIESAIDISYSDYSAYFLLKDVSNFTGSLSATGAGIAIGASKPSSSTTGGKIILTTIATIATGKTWTATEGIVLADAAASLTNTDGALDPAPTTNVSRHRVVSSTSAGVTTYRVEEIPGTIFSVY